MKAPRQYYLDVEIIKLIEQEAEERNTDKAVIVREALQEYFEDDE